MSLVLPCYQTKATTDTYFLWIMNTEILRKILASQIQHIKKILPTITRWNLYQECKIYIWKSINIIHHINKMKNKNYIIISIDKEKAFDKIQHCFTIETLNKQTQNGTVSVCWVLKVYMENPELTPCLMGKDWLLSPKIMKKARMSTLATFIQHCSCGSSQRNLARKRNKNLQFGNERV